MPELANRQIRVRHGYAKELAPRWYWSAGEPAPNYKPWEHKATLAQWNDINWTLGMVSKIAGFPRHGFSSLCVCCPGLSDGWIPSICCQAHACLLGSARCWPGLSRTSWASINVILPTCHSWRTSPGIRVEPEVSEASSLEMIPLRNPLAVLLPKQLFSAWWDVCLTFILAWYKECMWG